MKFMILASLLSFSAFAQTPPVAGQTFDQRKQMMMENFELRLAHVTAGKACVQAAKDDAGLKQCHSEMKEKRKEMKGAMTSKREAFKAQRRAGKANKAQ